MNKYRILLAGNPNVGKSTIFNILTGLRQHTGNWSGKTVSGEVGYYKYNDNKYEIVDLPGTISINTNSLEEEVAKEYLVNKDYDLVVVVCNAVALERSLNLVLQVLNITNNVIVLVNLMDEAKKRGIKIDIDKLSSILGVPVIPCSATKREGIDTLKETIYSVVNNMNSNTIKIDNIKYTILECHKICNLVLDIDKNSFKRDRYIDRILTNKITGIPIMLMMLFVIFWLTITFSNYPSDMLFRFFSLLEDNIYNFFSFLPKYIDDIIVYGGYKTTYWVISVMLPPMMIFFPLFTLLEDIGVLPRIAFNLDGIFQRCNSCGKQALTMCMGIGCNAVGVTGARIIDSKRERLLAILSNSFMPCNGRYPTIIAVIVMFFANNKIYSNIISSLILVLIIVISIIVTFIVNKILSKTILKGNNGSFILELSDYRRVRIIPLIVRSIFERSLFVLGRALVISLPFGLIIYLINNYSIFNINMLSSIFNPLGLLMGLDGIILISFLLGFPANEIVMPVMLMIYLGTKSLTNYDSIDMLKSVLVSNGWTIKTAICFIIFSVFHFPCSTTILTIKRETGSWYYTFLAFVIPTIIGILLCMFINFII